MALTEKDITVIGVNTTEYVHLTAYVMFCYKTFEDYAILHLDPVATPIDELRRGIVEKQYKLVLVTPALEENTKDDRIDVSFHTDDPELLNGRVKELKKIFRACFFVDLVPVEKEVLYIEPDEDEMEKKNETISLKFYAHGVMVNAVNN